MPLFEHYIGIDYSGAQTPTSSLKGLRVYAADWLLPPKEIPPTPPFQRQYWTRRAIAEWLCEQLSGSKPTLVGIDHGFSFPLAYFKKHNLPFDWHAFLDDFRQHWPTDDANTYVEFLREGNKRTGDTSWLRLTERWTATAKSVFLFDVQGSVAKSTHAGLPWLRYLRQHGERRIHFWPFDGWDIPQGRSVVAEVYPSLWTRHFPVEERNGDQHAAYSVAAWLRRADTGGSLPRFFNPPLVPEEREIAGIEGWTLGVM
jgi:hypothetical protein